MYLRNIFKGCFSVTIFLLLTLGCISLPGLGAVAEVYGVVAIFNTGLDQRECVGFESKWGVDCEIGDKLEVQTVPTATGRTFKGWNYAGWGDDTRIWKFCKDTVPDTQNSTFTLTAIWDPSPTTKHITFEVYGYPPEAPGAQPYSIGATVHKGSTTKVRPLYTPSFNGGGSVLPFNSTTDWYTDPRFETTEKNYQFAGATFETVTEGETIKLYARFKRRIRFNYPTENSHFFTSPRWTATNDNYGIYFVDKHSNPGFGALGNISLSTYLTKTVDSSLGIYYSYPYSIDAWYRNVSDTTRIAGLNINIPDSNASGLVAGDFNSAGVAAGVADVFAKPVEPSNSILCTVKLYDNNGDDIKTFQVPKGSKLMLPTLAQKNGADFDGWYSGSTNWSNSSYSPIVNGDIELTARYVYTITYELLGGQIGTSETYGPTKVILGEPLPKPPDPARNNATFVGWYYWADSLNYQYIDFDSGPFYDIPSSITLYAEYAADNIVFAPGEPTSVTVTYDSAFPNDPEKIIATQRVPVGLPFDNKGGAPSDNTYLYSFGGWYTDGGIRWDFSNMATNTSITLHAKWLKNLRVYYYMDTPNSPFVWSFPIIEGGSVSLITNVTNRYGYKFKNQWVWINEAEPLQSITYQAGESVTLTQDMIAPGTTNIIKFVAKWDKLPSIEFDYNYDNLKDTVYADTKHPTQGDKFCYDSYPMNPVPTRPGYEFGGWYDSSGTRYYNNSAIGIDENIKLKAQWNLGSIKITFDPNITESGFTPVSIYAYEGEDIKGRVPVFQKNSAGKEVVGWYWKEDLSIGPVDFTAYRATGVPVKNYTLYAKWGPPAYLEITFNDPYGNLLKYIDAETGVVIEPGTRTVPNGSTLADLKGTPDGIPTPINSTEYYWVSGGWSAESGTGQAWGLNDSFEKDMTLTAIVSHRVSFDSKGGTAISCADVYPDEDDDEPPYKLVIRENTLLTPRGYNGVTLTEIDYTPIRPGYIFLGWYKDESYSKPWKYYERVNKHTTLYALWAESPDIQPVISVDSGGRAELIVQAGNSKTIAFNIKDDALPLGRLDYYLVMADGSALPDSVEHNWAAPPVATAIDSITGQVVLTFSPIPGEENNKYTLWLMASDDGGNTKTKKFVITLQVIEARAGYYMWFELLPPGVSGTPVSIDDSPLYRDAPPDSTGAAGTPMGASLELEASGSNVEQAAQGSSSGSSNARQSNSSSKQTDSGNTSQTDSSPKQPDSGNTSQTDSSSKQTDSGNTSQTDSSPKQTDSNNSQTDSSSNDSQAGSGSNDSQADSGSNSGNQNDSGSSESNESQSGDSNSDSGSSDGGMRFELIPPK